MNSATANSDSGQTLDDILTLDEVGLSALHARFYPQVYQFVYFRLHDDQLSETVTREVFLESLSEARNPHDQQRNLRGWLMSCASRRVNEQLQPGVFPYEGEGVTSFQAPQEEMVINPEAEELSRRKFLAMASRARRRKSAPSFKWLKWLAGLLAILLILFAAASVIGSLQITPASSLYRARRIVEEARLLLAGNASQRLKIEKAIDQDRLAEINRLIQARRGPIEVTLVGGVTQMSPDEWVVGDVPVQIPPEAQLVGKIEPGMYIQVAGVLQPEGVVRATRIQPREYPLSGKIQRIQDGTWFVDSIPIQVSPETILRGQPAGGSQVKLIVYRQLDDSLLARWAEVGGN